MEGSGALWDDPEDGQPHAGEQGDLPRLAEHEVEDEDQSGSVPHDQTQLLAQCLTHAVGIRGDTRHNFP